MPKRRTTLYLDNETVHEAQALTGARSQSAMVQMALEKLIRSYRARALGSGIVPGGAAVSRRPRLPGER